MISNFETHEAQEADDPAIALLIPQIFDLSSGQARVWLTEQMLGAMTANTLCLGLRLWGKLNPDALELSFRIVVRRHEILRTTFDLVNGHPVQLVHQTIPQILSHVDLSDSPTAEQAAYAFAGTLAVTPFDLKCGPLLRAVLLRLESEQHVLFCTLHHIVADGWSLRLLVRELIACYAAICEGRRPVLEPLQLQYADCAAWEAEWLASEEFNTQLARYTARFADLSPPLFTPGSQTPSTGGGSHTIYLEQETVSKIRLISQQRGATFFILALAVFHMLLWQTFGSTDQVIGIPAARRNKVEVEGLVGLFTNIVVVRANFPNNLCFADLLIRTKNAVIEALEHEDVPFDRLVQALHPARSYGENPVFQVLFASITAATPEERFGPIKAAPYVVDVVASPFVLGVSLIEDSLGNAWVQAQYQEGFGAAEQVHSLLDHYTHLLLAVTQQPEAQICHFKGPPWRRSTPPILPRMDGSDRLRPESAAGKADGSELRWFEKPSYGNTRLGAARAPLHGAIDTALERMLCDIWEGVLQCRPFNREADFFNLGGHSLQAITVAHRIGQRLGRTIPVSMLFRNPTIAGMANQIHMDYLSPSNLVPVFLGGTRPPLFVGGSGTREYSNLSRSLEPDQPFFQLDILAMQERRLLTGNELLTTIPAIAAEFLSDLLEVQPNGPYLLAGMCDGGILVLELALQLQASGHEVVFLAQFDTPVDGYYRRCSWKGWLSNRAVADLKIIRSGQALDRVRRMAWPTDAERRYFTARAAIWTAVYNYVQPKQYEGELHLFRAAEQFSFFEDVATGWEKRATRIRLHTVPGDHYNLLSNLATQARVAAEINRALGGRSSNEVG